MNLDVLNDMYFIDIGGKDLVVKDVNSKAGIEMTGQLFKSLLLNDNNYAFFNDDLRKMYVFNVNTEIFTKIIIKFVPPPKRTNYSINRLKDGRIIIFGGMDEEEAFRDCALMINFTFETERSYTWVTLDIYGNLEEGSNGHCAVVLPNNNIYIHGGSRYPYDPIITKYINADNIRNEIKSIGPLVSRKSKLLNIHDTYNWNILVYGK